MSGFAQSLKAFFQRPPKEKRLSLLAVFWILLLLVPLVGLCFHVYPSHDDFPNILPAAQAYAESGSLLSLVKAAWNSMVHDYLTWQGTFFAMFYSALQPTAVSLNLAWVSPLGILLLLVTSSGFLLHRLLRRWLGWDRRSVLLALAGYLTLQLEFTPGLKELFYWQAALQYTIGWILIQFLLGLLISLHTGSQRKTGKILLCGILSLLIGGSPYTLALGCLVALGLLALWAQVRKSSARGALWISFGLMGVALAVVLLAPGNALRQTRVGDSLPPITAIVYSLAECAEYTARWSGLQVIAFLLLLYMLMIRNRAPVLRSFSFQKPLLFSILSFGVLAAVFVPAVYAMGQEAYKLDRILGSNCLVFEALLLMNGVYWFGWALRRCPYLAKPVLNRPLLLLCLVLTGWACFGNPIWTTPSLSAARSLVSGEAAAYTRQQEQREQLLLEAASPAEARAGIEPLENEPLMLRPDVLPAQKNSSLPLTMHRILCLQDLCKTYGAGHIPQSELDALDEWALLP